MEGTTEPVLTSLFDDDSAPTAHVPLDVPLVDLNNDELLSQTYAETGHPWAEFEPENQTENPDSNKFVHVETPEIPQADNRIPTRVKQVKKLIKNKKVTTACDDEKAAISRNALAARENRNRHKIYVQNLKNDNGTLQKELDETKKSEAKLLNHCSVLESRVAYLEAIVKYDSRIAETIKQFQDKEVRFDYFGGNGESQNFKRKAGELSYDDHQYSGGKFVPKRARNSDSSSSSDSMTYPNTDDIPGICCHLSEKVNTVMFCHVCHDRHDRLSLLNKSSDD